MALVIGAIHLLHGRTPVRVVGTDITGRSLVERVDGKRLDPYRDRDWISNLALSAIEPLSTSKPSSVGGESRLRTGEVVS